MHIAILHNDDHAVLDDDPGREAREDVVRVAEAMATALSRTAHTVQLVPVERDLITFQKALALRRPDVVVNLCESLNADARGEMVIPSLLELLDVPFTGSQALSLGLSLHKNKAKEILKARGVPTPGFCVVERVEDLVSVDLPFPLIVKPSREDASVGIDFDSVVSNRAELGRAVTKVLRTFKQPAIVEQYIEGREVYVPLLGNGTRRALPLSEISFGAAFEGKPNIVSYRAKWEAESAECIDSPSGPASLTPELEARCVEVAMRAFDALECRDYGRVDMRVDAAGQCYVIDINPNCDLHPEAGFSRAAATAGIDYAELALHLVELALERHHGHQAPRPRGQDAARGAAQAHRDVHPGRGAVRPRTHRRRRTTQSP